MSTPACVFLDIDDTLYRQGTPLSGKNADALQALRANGHRFFLCTARVPPNLPRELIALEPDGVISGAGAHITAGGKVVHTQYIPPDILRDTMGRLFAFRIPMALGGVEGTYCLPLPDEYPGPTFLWNSPADLDTLGPEPSILKMSFFMPMPMLRRKLTPMLEKDFQLIVYSSGYCDAVSHGVDKGLGVKLLLRHLGLEDAPTYAFGDSEGDIPMFRSVKTPIAMGGSAVGVRGRAVYTTAAFEQDGVAAGLRHFGLI